MTAIGPMRRDGPDQIVRLRSRRGLHVEILGRGRPVLFLNGLFQSLESWQAVTRLLSPGMSAICFDFMNQGLSEADATAARFEDYCAAVPALMDELDLDPAETSIVGFSVGAEIARALVLDHGLPVRRLILGAVSPPGMHGYWRRWFESLAVACETGGVDMLVRMIAFHMFSPAFIAANPRIIDVMTMRYRQYYGHRPECLLRLIGAQATRDFRQEQAVRPIGCPVDLIVPEHDSLVPAPASRGYATAIGAKMHSIACGHTFAVEAPEQTAALVSSILGRDDVARTPLLTGGIPS